MISYKTIFFLNIHEITDNHGVLMDGGRGLWWKNTLIINISLCYNFCINSFYKITVILLIVDFKNYIVSIILKFSFKNNYLKDLYCDV